MIDITINNDNFKKKLFNGFFDASLNPIDLDKKTIELLRKNLKELNNKHDFNNYGHLSYILLSNFQAYSFHSGYAVTVGDDTYRSYLIFDKNFNIDSKRCFFYRDHFSRNVKYALFCNKDIILDFTLHTETKTLTIEEKKNKDDKLVFSQNSKNFKINHKHFNYTNSISMNAPELVYSNFTGDYHTAYSHKITSPEGLIINFVENKEGTNVESILDNYFYLKFNGFELLEIKDNVYHVFLENFDKTIENYNNNSNLNTKQIDFYYNDKTKEISTNYPFEQTLKNSKEIQDFCDLLKLMDDTLNSEKCNFYLNNIEFFIDIKNKFSKDNTSLKILKERYSYDIICEKIDNISTYFEGDMKNRYKKNKIKEDFPALKNQLVKHGFKL